MTLLDLYLIQRGR